HVVAQGRDRPLGLVEALRLDVEERLAELPIAVARLGVLVERLLEPPFAHRDVPHSQVAVRIGRNQRQGLDERLLRPGDVLRAATTPSPPARPSAAPGGGPPPTPPAAPPRARPPPAGTADAPRAAHTTAMTAAAAFSLGIILMAASMGGL